MGALEKRIRSYPENPEQPVVEPAIGMTFDSLGEAYDFYNLYSWEHGFGIRYGKSRLNPEKTKTMQEIVCGCSVSIYITILRTFMRVGSVMPDGRVYVDSAY
jgi:hypothetical protein